MPQENERVVLITGCSTGIGRQTAIYLASRGWRVFASTRRLDDIRDLASPRVTILSLDVSDESSRVQVVNAVVTQAGRLDALVNNAGVNVSGPLELISLEDARAQFETNVWGALRLAQLAIPVMRAQGGGRIVNISSVMAQLSLPYSGLYCASKRAIEAISEVLRWELSPWNIQISVVEPGSYRSSIGDKARAFRARFVDDPLYGRYLAGLRSATPPARRPHILSGAWRKVTGMLSGKDPVGAARVIERALDDKHPGAQYKAGIVTSPAILLHRIIPGRLYDYGIRRFYRFERIPSTKVTSRSELGHQDLGQA